MTTRLTDVRAASCDIFEYSFEFDIRQLQANGSISTASGRYTAHLFPKFRRLAPVSFLVFCIEPRLTLQFQRLCPLRSKQIPRSDDNCLSLGRVWGCPMGLFNAVDVWWVLQCDCFHSFRELINYVSRPASRS